MNKNEEDKINNIIEEIKSLNVLDFKKLMNKYCMEFFGLSLSEIILKTSSNNQTNISDQNTNNNKKENVVKSVSLSITDFPQEDKKIIMSIIKFIKKNDDDITSLFQASAKVKALPITLSNLTVEKSKELQKELIEISDKIVINIKEN